MLDRVVKLLGNRFERDAKGASSHLAVLALSQVHTTLVDPGWADARIQFIEASHARKPSF